MFQGPTVAAVPTTPKAGVRDGRPSDIARLFGDYRLAHIFKNVGRIPLPSGRPEARHA